jgi:DNA-binding GntR family transcriptional regulator
MPPAVAAEIKSRYADGAGGVTQAFLAREFGVSITTVRRAINGRR